MSGGGFIRVWGGYVRLRSVCYKAVLLLYCVARARATSELRALPSYHVPQGSALLWMEAAFRATDDNNICRVFGAPARSGFRHRVPFWFPCFHYLPPCCLRAWRWSNLWTGEAPRRILGLACGGAFALQRL